VEAVLLASEGRKIPVAATDLAADIARRSGAPVHVFTIARVWGTSFGFPNPGLMPTRHEWDEQRSNVDSAIGRLERRGVEADGRVLGTRSGAKRIVQEAVRHRCGAIVMAADPPKGTVRGDLDWAQEPYRVRRRSPVPVYLLVNGKRANV
jgi:nucleotide-binding universal stress UspA family protein